MRRTLPIAALFVFGNAAADDSPLRIRNLAPAAGIYGEPRALGGDVLASGYELTFSTELANNFTGAAYGDTRAVFDGETTYLTYGMRHAFAQRWEWGVEVPYVIQRGGDLDSAIDKFHDVFGFDDNDRNAVGRDEINYVVTDRGANYVDVHATRQDWGDLRVSGGYQVFYEPERSLAIRALVKLPTGNVDQLTGSHAADVATWLDYSDRDLLARFRLSLSGALGVMLLGDGDLLPQDQRPVAGYAHFGISHALSDAWALKAQLDYHSELIDTSIDQLGGQALQGSVGAHWRFNGSLWTELALAEDLTPDSTSDVLLQLLLGVDL